MTSQRTGPVAVITGAASGIGAACAERLRHGGWRIAAIDLRDSDADLAVTADVRDRAAVTAAVDEAAARFGRIDLAVTAAGYPSPFFIGTWCAGLGGAWSAGAVAAGARRAGGGGSR